MTLGNVKDRAVELGVYLPLGAYAKLREEVAGWDATSARRLYRDFVGRGQKRVRPVERRLRREGRQAAGAAASAGRAATNRGRAATSTRAPRAAAVVVRPSELPIKQYDSLTVEEILPKLHGLTNTELTKVKAFERGNAKRATVLEAIDSKITRLPIADYDALTADEIGDRLEGLGKSQLTTLRRYEEATKGRSTVIDRIDSKLS